MHDLDTHALTIREIQSIIYSVNDIPTLHYTLKYKISPLNATESNFKQSELY